jgi:hypothetical protein
MFVTTGLIAGACLSGLPSATCYALADAYTIGFLTLGSLFVLELLLGILIPFLKGLTNALTIPTDYLKVSEIMVGLGVIVLLVTSVWFLVVLADTGYGNIRRAINQCFLEHPQEKDKDSLYKRIPLYNRNLPFSHPYTLE